MHSECKSQQASNSNMFRQRGAIIRQSSTTKDCKQNKVSLGIAQPYWNAEKTKM